MALEAFRSFVPAQGTVPIETVGIRRSARRPGERRLTLVRPPEPEQPKTLLQEMQGYLALRQHLRELGHYQVMGQKIIGREPANICLADASHTSFFSCKLDTPWSPPLPDQAS